MIEEQFSLKPINFVLLDSQFREALGESYNGIMVSSMIRVFLNAPVERQTVQAIIDDHDASELTAEQQAEANAAAALEAARANHAETLNLSQFAPESEVIQALAGYVAWLELELRDLRGL